MVRCFFASGHEVALSVACLVLLQLGAECLDFVHLFAENLVQRRGSRLGCPLCLDNL